MRRGTFWLAMLCICSATFASDGEDELQPVIAVHVTGAKDPAVNRALGVGVQYALLRSMQYSTTWRNEAFLAAITEEEQAGSSGEKLDSRIIFHAKRIGVEFVCFVDMVHAFDNYYISARIVDAETGETTARGSADNPLKTIEDIRGASVDIVRELLDLSVSAKLPAAAVLRSRNPENIMNDGRRQFSREPSPPAQTIRQPNQPAGSGEH